MKESDETDRMLAEDLKNELEHTTLRNITDAISIYYEPNPEKSSVRKTNNYWTSLINSKKW